MDNCLDGSEDTLLRLHVMEYWDELGMPGLRAKVMAEVQQAVAGGLSLQDYQSILEPFDDHAPQLEGQEAFGHMAVDGEPDIDDATDSNVSDDDDAGDEGGEPPGGGCGFEPSGPPAAPPPDDPESEGLDGPGAPPLPPTAGSPHTHHEGAASGLQRGLRPL